MARAEITDLEEIFAVLRKELVKYQKHFVVRDESARCYQLWSEKPVEIAGRKHKEIFFASAAIQGKFVGFYYMPIYGSEKLRAHFKPELLGLLKGKACFHVKVMTPELRKQIAEALKIGYEAYRKNGWV